MNVSIVEFHKLPKSNNESENNANIKPHVISLLLNVVFTTNSIESFLYYIS